MKRLTIYTQQYENLLRDFAKGLDIFDVKFVRHGKNRLFCMCLTWENETNALAIDRLAAFLQDVAALENPVYRYSIKMREMAKALQETSAHSVETKRLKAFLRGSRVLNLEGYITFRMSEYRHKLDIMSYRAIKKIELTRKE